MLLLSAGLWAGAAQAQAQVPAADALAAANATSNVPPRSGEASTMTNGVPNLLTSNVQPGELGIQSRLTVRKKAAPAYAGDPALKLMGASGPMRPVLIAPPRTEP
ncbi:hypothetical protein ACFPOE_03465 [Caenimonas terrae]|uniref:Uncharacterized protein n=1 Tax=Caenimonas terrae TaxID=696074 RepID=A0ABW0N8J9_9BURK